MNSRIIFLNVIFANLIFPAVPLLADLQQNPTTGRFYSIPMSPDINQTEYDHLMQICCLMCSACLTYSVFKCNNDAEAVSMLHSFLQKIGTPTSKRLMADIKKDAKHPLYNV